MAQIERRLDTDLEVIHGNKLEIRDVKWLWYPYIPFGKIVILVGYRVPAGKEDRVPGRDSVSG